MPATASSDRTQRLVDLLATVGLDLELGQVLERVMSSACLITDARHGILLLANSESQVTDFVLHGFSTEERRIMGPQPDFLGMTGILSRSRRAVRVEDTRTAERVVNFPPGHPTPSTILSLPIAMPDESLGQIYLADKASGTQFTEADERGLEALVTAAGIAIRNARLHERERRRHLWLEATAEITHQLLGEVDRDRALRTVTRRLRDVSGADACGMLLVDPTDPSLVDLDALEGIEISRPAGIRTALSGLPAKVVETGQGVVTRDFALDAGSELPPNVRDALADIGLGMVMPLNAHGDTIGTLFVGWRRGSPDERLAATERPLVEMFASQAALVLQQVRAQRIRARLLVLEDRDRIAHDLHDAVIQRLFAIGTRLHSASGLSTRPEVQRRITTAIDDLDETTQVIRSTIFHLHDHDLRDEPSIRDRLLAEVDASRERFGFAPRLVLHGGIDTVAAQTRRELVGVLRDALAVAAKHGSPSLRRGGSRSRRRRTLAHRVRRRLQRLRRRRAHARHPARPSGNQSTTTGRHLYRSHHGQGRHCAGVADPSPSRIVTNWSVPPG